MSDKFDELHNRLSAEGVTDTKLNTFAERLYLIIDDIDYVVSHLKQVNENGMLKTKIYEKIKGDKKTGRGYNDYAEAIKNYDSKIEETNSETNKERTNEDSRESDNEKGKNELNEKVIENAKKVNVQIKGEIKNPGAYTLNEGSTINDLIIAAGALTDIADKNNINYLKEVSDGECIEIPAEKIQVLVKGAVHEPGLKKVKKGTSVEKIICLCGGLNEEADDSSIDYFSELYDGVTINVKKKEKICVDIVGAVERPGAYRIASDDRLEAVIKECGLTEKADLSSFNQAQRLTDGEKIIIPSIDEVTKKDLKDKTEEKVEETILSDASHESTPANEKEKDKKEKEERKEKSEVISPEINKKHYIIEKQNKIAERNNRLIQFFNWIKAMLQINMRRLPGTIQSKLEAVKDPVKLDLLIDGYNKGLSKPNFTRLLKEHESMSSEKLKHLIDFYLELDIKSV